MLCSTESAAVRKPACADLTKTDSTIGKTDRKEGKRKLNDQMTRHCTCRDTVSCHLQGLLIQCLQPNPEIKSHSCCNPTKIHKKASLRNCKTPKAGHENHHFMICSKTKFQASVKASAGVFVPEVSARHMSTLATISV